MKSYKKKKKKNPSVGVIFQILHKTTCQNFRLNLVKTAWEIANFFVDPRTEDDVVYHPRYEVYQIFNIVLYKSSTSVQQFKYTGLDVFCHWSVAAGERLGAMVLLPCVRAVIACVVSGVLLCLKKLNSFRRKNNGFMLVFCKSNTYIKCGGFA